MSTDEKALLRHRGAQILTAFALAACSGCASTEDPQAQGTRDQIPEGPTASGGGDSLASEGPIVGHVILTNAAGKMAESVEDVVFAEASSSDENQITVDPTLPKQKLYGIGGSLTEASASVLAELPDELRTKIINDFFGEEGAHYALARTHIGSCDFSTYSYCYAPEQDPSLTSFSIDEDRNNGLLQLIKDAKSAPGASFKLMASPWTAPPWMKDTGAYYVPASGGPNGKGGRLLKEHYATFAEYVIKYLTAYKQEGIDVWAMTPVNEPHGNNGGWESMEMSPAEQLVYIRDYLAPGLRDAGLDVALYYYDQNRTGAEEFADVIAQGAPDDVAGIGVHWYDSTHKVYEEVFERLHAKYPNHEIFHTEGTIDDLAGESSCNGGCQDGNCGCEELYSWWQEDSWYWEAGATDWGYDWDDRWDTHRPYVPTFRYVRDIVVSLDHWVNGWIDWNFVLNKRGGPNHVGNYCAASVMIDPDTQEVHYTPIYYAMKQLSQHIRPDGRALTVSRQMPSGVSATAVANPDGSVAVHVLNENEKPVSYLLRVGDVESRIELPASGLQTVVIPSGI